ncbi:hypothetical protein EV702DRAFT_1052015 [Suillus placidus]|uniref:Uncharacterized protein n=1 Tax=Suillus placidus TaxID=48579 RepID=A0A9P7CVA0_9AGAM|nr:hypothetical protein EV702DRAFT_1052015 [Suillus placidus]
MNSPSDTPGVFTSGDSKNDVGQWQMLLLGNDLSSQCQLQRVVYATGKEHGFLLLHFLHPTQQHAVAVLALDRVPVIIHSLAISFSNPRPRFHLHYPKLNGSAIDSYLSRTYDNFKRLSYLDFSASARPSAIQVSVLLTALSKHSPTYNLYQYQCYWYAHTVWEALKRLFLDCYETTQDEGRSRYLGVKIEKADSVEAMCEEYHTQWARVQNAAVKKRKAKEDEVRQSMMEGQIEERARCQVEIDQAMGQREEVERKAEEYKAEMDPLRARMAQLERRASLFDRHATLTLDEKGLVLIGLTGNTKEPRIRFQGQGRTAVATRATDAKYEAHRSY